jgi:hypothetical protein
LTRPAEALLAPRFATSTAYFSPGLRRSGAATTRRQLRSDHLVENCHVRLDPKYIGVEGDIAFGGSIGAI